jgi:RHS repeat-associated protein
MLSGLGGKIMEYDGENRPLSVTYLGKKTCYVYGVDGKRLKKVEGLSPATLCTALPPAANGTTYFGPVEVRNWLGAEQVLTYPQPSVKLTNGVATWLHFDHLGSVRAITDATGAKVESAIYRPFGEQSEWLQPGTPAPETKGWIGERYDADAGLQYLNARYYDPALGLFLQPDWFEVTKPGVGTNRFSYSFNDPVNKIDPGGNWCIPCGAAVIEVAKWAGVAIGVGVVGYTAVETIDGSIVSTPDDDFEFDQEGFSDDPSANDATVLSDPPHEETGIDIEGVTGHSGSGPTIHSTPINDIQLGDNIFEASRLREALGLSTGDRKLAHHNIPSQHKGHLAVQKGISGGYDFEGAMNGTKVVGQAGGHPAYNRRIEIELDQMLELGLAEGWTNEQYRDALQEISDRERRRILEEDDGIVKNE